MLGAMLAGVVTASGFAQGNPAAAPTLVSSNRNSAAVAPKPALKDVHLSPASRDIQRLAQAQVDEIVILACITNCPGLYSLTADQIIHLKQAGVAPHVINAMMQHDQDRLSGNQPLTAATAPPVIAGNASRANESLIVEDDYYIPEQPESIGPVRAPYPVKLSDPIVILKLPSFTVPCW